MAGASSFFLFLEILITKYGVAGGIYGVNIISLDVITATKGTQTEAFIWWVRWWEILERRENKKKAKKEDEEKKKKAAAAAAEKAAQKDKPMKAEDAVLQQMAAAQM